MNQTTILSLLCGAVGLVSAQAGTSYVAPGPMTRPAQIEVPTLCQCFEANTASVSLYASGLLSNGSGDLNDAMGAGIALDYFFSENVGIQVEASFADLDDSVQLFAGSLVYRFPIKEICLAPYVFAGGGVFRDNGGEGEVHTGAGLDYRFNEVVGVFADARYTWTEDSDEFTLVRGGLRFAF